MHPLKREFRELYEASGWSQAEVARRLHMTRGGVNGIITGTTVPRPRTLELFKEALLKDNPQALTAAGSQPPQPPALAPDITAQIAAMDAEEKSELETMVRAALRLVKRSRPADLKQAAQHVAEHEAAIREIAQRSGEESSGRTSGPKRGAAGGKGQK